MKILHVIQGFTSDLGGLTSSTVELVDNLQFVDINVIKLLTPLPVDSRKNFMGEGLDWVYSFANDLRTPIGLSAKAKHILEQSDFDIYHINGLWQYILHKGCTTARSKKKPYIITPHGMLYPEALNRSGWKKWILKKLWFEKDIYSATCMHATCDREMENIRKFGYKGPVAVIGNPLSVPTYTKEIIENREYSWGGKLKIGFLGRLHPIKCIERLIEGVALSQNKEKVQLILIGSGTAEYENHLKTLISQLNLDNSVEFVGFLEGEQKYRQLAALSALFLPSEMENFGMIVLESLLVGTPVMASFGTPWKALNDEKCGWWCDNSPKKIAEIIDEIVSLKPKELRAMGQRGVALLHREYEAKIVARKMMDVYRWILGEGVKPDFVYAD